MIGGGTNPPDLQALADTHAGTALRGLLMPTIVQVMHGGPNDGH